MTKRYDVVVIGTGSAASSVASQCRAAERTVAIIDSRPFGGTCALRGCDPKKVLVGAGEAIDWIRRLSGKGIESEGVRTLPCTGPAMRPPAMDRGLHRWRGTRDGSSRRMFSKVIT